MRRIFLAIGFLPALVLCSRAQPTSGTPPLQKFTGTDSQTTSDFTVSDRWEVRWEGIRGINISVLSTDRTLVAGAESARGALFVPKGGTYHLQIDVAPAPNFPRPGPAPMSGFQSTISGDKNSPNSPPQQPMPPAGAFQYRVEVVQIDAVAATSSDGFFNNFVLPTGSQDASSPPTTPSPTANAVANAANAVASAATAVASTAATAMSNDQARAVVLITGDNAEGTGFMVKTPDGPVVVTNIHVIANNPNLKVTTNTGGLVTVTGMKGASDRDLAMLSIKDSGYSYLDFDQDISHTVLPGDDVITPGNSQGGEVMLNTTGKVLGIGPERIEIDNPIYHGNSGGPVFHPKSGKVLGVVTEAEAVDTTDDLDKASFESRNSAIKSKMRYFALRLDTVSEWVPIDQHRFAIETLFLDQFHEQSRRLDAYLNKPDTSSRNPNNANSSDDQSKIYLNDDKIMKANDTYVQEASGSDTAGKIDALRDLLFSLQSIASADVDQIQNPDNFYSFDKDRAAEELDYRKALQKELDGIGNDVTRLGGLPRTNGDGSN